LTHRVASIALFPDRCESHFDFDFSVFIVALAAVRGGKGKNLLKAASYDNVCLMVFPSQFGLWFKCVNSGTLIGPDIVGDGQF